MKKCKINKDENSVFCLKKDKNSHITYIIATIGIEFFKMDSKNLMERLIKNNITHIRVNVSKFETEDSVNDLKTKLISMKNITSDKLNIMLDLPIPYKKTRFLLAGNEVYLEVKRGDKLKMVSSRHLTEENTLYLLGVNDDFFKGVHAGESIKYGDGECELIVLKVEYNSIMVEVQNDAKIFAKKSLSFANSILDSRNEINNNKYTNLLKDIKPWAVAFSFISSKRDVLDMRQYLLDIGVETEIISKIETIEGVNNISEILEVSNVMLARGDLSVNVPIEYFYDTQEYIFRKVINSERKIYVATGILSSLSVLNVPTQAEITDLSFILKNNPQGIVLNYGVVRSLGFEKAIELIRRIEYDK